MEKVFTSVIYHVFHKRVYVLNFNQGRKVVNLFVMIIYMSLDERESSAHVRDSTSPGDKVNEIFWYLLLVSVSETRREEGMLGKNARRWWLGAKNLSLFLRLSCWICSFISAEGEPMCFLSELLQRTYNERKLLWH